MYSVTLRLDCAYVHTDIELHCQHIESDTWFLGRDKSRFTPSVPSKIPHADSVALDRAILSESYTVRVSIEYSSIDLPIGQFFSHVRLC